MQMLHVINVIILTLFKNNSSDVEKIKASCTMFY